MKDRKQRMDDLIADLGGRALVRDEIGISESRLRDMLASRAFSAQHFGGFLDLGHRQGVKIPTDLFGRSEKDHWPAALYAPAAPVEDKVA